MFDEVSATQHCAASVVLLGYLTQQDRHEEKEKLYSGAALLQYFEFKDL